MSLVHGFETQDAGRGLFAASYHPRNQMPVLCVDGVDQVSAVVDDEVRPGFDDPVDPPFIFLRAGSMYGEDVEAFMDQGGGDIVLSGEGIASGDEHLRPSMGEDFAKVGCLGLKMDRKGYSQSFERLF